MTRLYAPSDLVAGRVPSGSVRLGGRVLDVRGARLVLADALAQVELEGAGLDTLAPRPGDLLELELESAAPGATGSAESALPAWTIRTVLLHTRAPEPRGSGEFSRLAFSGRGRVLAARSRALAATRAYFDAHGFLEVETPTFVPCPGLDPHVHSLGAVRRGARVDHLITSPELHMKRLLVGGLPRVYQVARAFRAEELGPHHEPEFTLVEWYRAFADFEEVLVDTEELVRAVARAVRGQAELTLTPTGAAIPARVFDVSQPFQRITVAEAFRRFARVDDVARLALEDEAKYFELLVDRVEPALALEERPVFLTHYPSSQAALARKDPNDPRFAERFELYVGGLELSNGFGELTDPAEQRARFEAELERRRATGEPLYPLDERFLASLEEGLPRAAGNALGFDRLLLLTLGESSIARTLAFSDEER